MKSEKSHKENKYGGLVIFLLICFGLTWIYDFLVIRNISMIKDVKLSAVLSSVGMYFPLIAHLLTRKILKEKNSLYGHKSMMLVDFLGLLVQKKCNALMNSRVNLLQNGDTMRIISSKGVILCQTLNLYLI